MSESLKKYISAILRNLSSHYRERLRILFVCTFWSAHLSLLQFLKNTLKTSALQKRFKRNLSSERCLFHWCLSLHRSSYKNCISDHQKMDSSQRHQLSWQCDVMSCSLSHCQTQLQKQHNYMSSNNSPYLIWTLATVNCISMC